MPTFIFTDIEGSTKLWQTHPERMTEILQRHDVIVQRSIEEQGGTVVKHTGDGFFAVFNDGFPLICALDIQKNLQEADRDEEQGIRVRIGIHSGSAENIGTDFFGPAVNKTARITDCAWGGQILFSEVVKDAYDSPAGSLVEDLGLHMLKDLHEPVRLFSLSSPDLRLREFPPLRSLSTRYHNLPAQTTPFIGREHEVEEITCIIGEGHRLVTLIGPGGIGKTRLAVQIAAEIFENYDNGVFFIPLDRLDSPDFLVPAISESLRFNISGDETEKTQLLNYFRDKRILLVFDNFEHIIEGALLVSELLSIAPGISVLATSREALSIKGERLYQVAGLDLPATDEQSAGQSGAVRLFLYIAERVAPGKILTDNDYDYITRICRLLGGQPLGIELAASWFRSHSSREIFEEIGENIDFLSSRVRDLPERHRSLRAVFDYSWVLLSAEEREVLARLSVFRGGFDRNAASSVAGAGISMLEGVLDKSLLRISPSGRYEMLYILREYAGRKLEETDPGMSTTREGHCRYYSGYLQDRLPDLTGTEQSKALEEITREIDNIKAAWEWAVAKILFDELASLARGLGLFLIRRGWYSQGRALFSMAVDLLEGRIDDHLFAVLLRYYGEFSIYVGELQTARELITRSLEILREREPGPDLAGTLITMSEVEKLLGNASSAEELLQESLEIVGEGDDRYLHAAVLQGYASLYDGIGDCQKTDLFAGKALGIWKELGDIFQIARSYSLHASAQLAMGEYDRAVEYYTEALEINRRCGHKADMAGILNNIAITYAMNDDEEKAERYFRESLDIRNEIGDRRGASAALSNLGVIAHNSHDLETALRLYNEALAICREIGHRNGISSHLMNLSQTYHDMNRFGKAKELGQEALDIALSIKDNWLIERALLNLGLCCFRLEEFAESKACHEDGLRRANEQGHVPLVAVALVGAARLLLTDGMSKQAYEVLYFILDHPGTPSGLVTDIDRVMDEIQGILTPEDQDACHRRSSALTKDGAVADMLAYLSQEAGDQPSG